MMMMMMMMMMTTTTMIDKKIGLYPNPDYISIWPIWSTIIVV